MDKTVSILINAKAGQAKRELKDVHANLERLSASARKVSMVSLAFGGSIAAAALLGGRAAVKAAGDMEVLDTAFTTLLGSASAAKKTMADLYKFAAETPFEDADVYRFGRSLLAAGFQAKDLTKVLTQVGDAVSAVGGGAEGMDRVIRAIQQMRAKGKISQEELNQISELGIPINKMLQEQMGLTAKQMENIGRAGIPAGKAIDALLKGMAKFGAGGMEKQSKTLVGLASTLSSEIKKLLTNVEGTGIGDRMLPSVKRAVTDILTEFKRLEADGTLKRFANDMGRLFLQGFEVIRKGMRFLLRNGPMVANAVKWTVIAGGVSLLVGAISGLVSMASGIVKLVGSLKMLTAAFIGLQTAQAGAAAGTTGFAAGMANIVAKAPGWTKILVALAAAAYGAWQWVKKVEEDRTRASNQQRRGEQFAQAQAAQYMKAVTRYPELGVGRGRFVQAPEPDKVLTLDEWNKLPEAERQNLRRQGRVVPNTRTVGQAADPTTGPALSGGGGGDIAPNLLQRQAGAGQPPPPKLRVLTESVTVKGRKGTMVWTPVGFKSEAQQKLSIQKVLDEFDRKNIEADIKAGMPDSSTSGAGTASSPTPSGTSALAGDAGSRAGVLQRLMREAASITLRSQPESLVNTREMARRENEQWLNDALDEVKGDDKAADAARDAVKKAFADRNSAIWREYHAAKDKADRDAAEKSQQIADEIARLADEQRRADEEVAEGRWTALEDFKTSVENLDEAQRENHRTRIDEMLERASESKTLSDQEKANIIAEFETWWALEIKRKKARQEELRTMAAVALVTGDFLRAARLQIEAIAAGIAVSDTEIARDSDIAGIKKNLEPEPVEAPETWRDRWRREWEERGKIAEQAMENVVQSFSSRLVDGLTGAKDAWKNFWKDLKNIALNAIKAIIEAWIKNRILGSGFGIQGGGGTGVSGGSPVAQAVGTALQAAGMPVQGGMMPNAILQQGGQGGGMPNMLGNLLGKKVGASSLGGLLGAGLLGYSLAPMLFGKNNHSGAGGGMGAMLGMALGGPLGALAGGLLGGALGSLFKKRRKPKPQAPGGFWEPNLYGWGMDQGVPAVGVTPYQQQNPWTRPGPGIQVQQNIYNTSPRPIDGLSQDLADRVARAGRVK